MTKPKLTCPTCNTQYTHLETKKDFKPPAPDKIRVTICAMCGEMVYIDSELSLIKLPERSFNQLPEVEQLILRQTQQKAPFFTLYHGATA